MKNLCAKCGACSTVCPVYRVTGREELTARGRLHLLGKMAGGQYSAACQEIFSRCLLCGACKQACPRSIDLPSLVVAARHELPRLGGSGSLSKFLATSCLARPTLLAGLADFLKVSAPLLRQLPADSGLRLKLGIFLETSGEAEELGQPVPSSPPPGIASTPDTLSIFSGCLARHLLPEIGRAADTLLAGAGHSSPRTPRTQTCCGLAAYSAGNLEEARRLARANLDAFGAGSGPILTPCDSCYSHLLTYPALLADEPGYQPRARAFVARLREMSSFLLDSQTAPASETRTRRTKPFRVLYHDPCHLRFRPGQRQATRQLLKAIPGLELVELAGGSQCCGLGGTFNLAHPGLSGRIALGLVEQVRQLAPDLVLSSCSGCLLQLHRELGRAGLPTVVKHLAVFLAEQ